MKKHLYLSFIAFFYFSCEDKTGTIKQDTYLDTVRKKDTVKIEQDLVFPEDNTEVSDSLNKY